MAQITRLPTASTLVAGEFVEYRPGHFVRAAAVQLVVSLGGEDGCLLSRAPGEEDGPLSPYPVHLVLAALNLALERGRERLVYSPEA
jgi:hypothetical protein